MSAGMTRQERVEAMQRLAEAGLTAKQAIAETGLPKATFYRLTKQAGIVWKPQERSRLTRQKHAESVRQTWIDSGRVLMVDVGNGPQTLRQVALERGIPYGTLKYRHSNKKLLFKD